ncbi:hypothetical protein V8B97DRAFT_1914585 [Scleroderma yunnanense]
MSKQLPSCNNNYAMAIDEPLLGLSSLTAGSLPWELPLQTPPPSHKLWSHQHESPLSSPASMYQYLCSSVPASLASVEAALAVQYPDIHERLMHINYKFSNDFNTTKMNTEHSTTQLEASQQYQVLLERRAKLEAMREDLQDENITSIGTQEIDNL